MILEKAEGIPLYLEELTKLFLAADEAGQSLAEFRAAVEYVCPQPAINGNTIMSWNSTDESGIAFCIWP
jgi:hypothetical protein